MAHVLAGLHRYGEIPAEAEHWKQQDPHDTMLQADFLAMESDGTPDSRLLHEGRRPFCERAGARHLRVGRPATWRRCSTATPAEALRICGQLPDTMPAVIGGQFIPKKLPMAEAFFMLGDPGAAQRCLLEARTAVLRNIESNPDSTASQMILS